MADKRIKLGPLNTAGAVASENRWVYRQLKAGLMEGTLAMKMSQILMNQRGMIESAEIEKRLAELEESFPLRRQGSGSPNGVARPSEVERGTLPKATVPELECHPEHASRTG